MPVSRAPHSTYRLQFNRLFTFKQTKTLLPYLDKLGVGAIYASPISKAEPGSLHGYDVTDPTALNPEIGDESSFHQLAEALRKYRLGLILDIVPNHMSIAHGANPWWNDILENGPSSVYASFFDIDWCPPKIDLTNKILLPELENQYGKQLEDQHLAVQYADQAFYVQRNSTRYPLTPRSLFPLFDKMLDRLKNSGPPADGQRLELESIRTALDHLPSVTETDQQKIEERYREKEIIKRRFSSLVAENPPVAEVLDKVLYELNGKKGQSSSFDLLETILNDQVYRLCYWRVASDEINYRRFFDVNNLAAIRMEERPVFESVHKLAFQFIDAGVATGLRIDHVDGLLDPKAYFSQLQERLKDKNANTPFYVVVEKVLLESERLRPDWAVSGTTGYDFMNDLNGLFVRKQNRRRFLDLYRRFTGRTEAFRDTVVSSKKLVMLVLMASELRMLATHLDRISEQHRWSRDFTFESLRFALREVVAGLPVYRTYISPDSAIGPDDHHIIEQTIDEAKRRNPVTDKSVFDFIGDVLMLNHPDGITDEQKKERLKFVLRFQQFTGPVMAKALEDTAFYRVFPLASLNEVGGAPESFGLTVSEFHIRNKNRLAEWPQAMLATTTHDTKRSEDVRSRIDVLSEIPTKWYRTIRKWEVWNRDKKIEIRGRPVPDFNEEYLLYQTLLGTWPLEKAGRHDNYLGRIDSYMMKALKEAKIHTSWINPNQEYENGVSAFINKILTASPRNRFLEDFQDFQKPMSLAGLLSSLSQLVLKTTSPGVPDFYQGTETWNFSLVDPDNRQPVDYERLMEMMEQLQRDTTARPLKGVQQMMRQIHDGRIKMYLTSCVLRHRRSIPELFLQGDYLPLDVVGPKKDHLCAFARLHQNNVSITVAGRFFLSLGDRTDAWWKKDVWRDTEILLPKYMPIPRFRDIFTKKEIACRLGRKGGVLPVSEIMNPLFVSVLEPAGGR